MSDNNPVSCSFCGSHVIRAEIVVAGKTCTLCALCAEDIGTALGHARSQTSLFLQRTLHGNWERGEYARATALLNRSNHL